MAPKGICPGEYYPGTGEYYLMWQKGLCRCKLKKGLCRCKLKKKDHTHTQKNMYMLTVSLCCTE